MSTSFPFDIPPALVYSGFTGISIYIAHYIGRRSQEKKVTQLQAIADDKAEETLKMWIANAAIGAEDKDLCRHFKKHIKELFEEVDSRAEREAWSASTHNLIDIYDRLHGIEQDAYTRMGRMMLKFTSEPETQTPPPRQLPERVVVSTDRGS